MDNRHIYFSLGSNVGDRKSHIEHALKHLDSKLNINAISSIKSKPNSSSPQASRSHNPSSKNAFTIICFDTPS